MFDTVIERFRAKFGARRIVPVVPGGRAIQLPADDDAELASEASGDRGMAYAYFITYRSAAGEISNRRIAPRRYEPATQTVLAWCFERQSPRRFRIDRIETVVDVGTGEVIETEGWIGLLRGGVAQHDERLRRIVTILVYLMRCDREVHPMEVEVIDAAAASFALRFDGTDELVGAARTLARGLVPDGEDVARAIQWIHRHDDRARIARLMLPFIDQVIMADGRIASEEAYCGGLLKDGFAAMIN